MDPFYGEVRLFSFAFAPQDWAFCNGARQDISQNPALYSLLGVTYGGDYRNYFNLPNMMGFAAMGTGTGAGLTTRRAGDVCGEANVGLGYQEIPQHTHDLQTLKYNNSSSLIDVPSPTVTISSTINQLDYSSNATFDPSAPPATMHPSVVGVSCGYGGSVQTHSNVAPYLALNFCICLLGIYPDRP